ncbi:MAG: hypothetical protein R2711_04870 [Acidimicrobiales bacterium]
MKIDQTAPSITGGPINAPNSAGTYSGPVTVRWACADALAGVLWCTGEQTIAEIGTHTVTGAAVDLAGNFATRSTTFTIVAPTGTVTGRVLHDDRGWPGSRDDLRGRPAPWQGSRPPAPQPGTRYRTCPRGRLADVAAYGYKRYDRTGSVAVLPGDEREDVNLKAAPTTPRLKERITRLRHGARRSPASPSGSTSRAPAGWSGPRRPDPTGATACPASPGHHHEVRFLGRASRPAGTATSRASPITRPRCSSTADGLHRQAQPGLGRPVRPGGEPGARAVVTPEAP